MTSRESVARILRVNHAGERGAICIYEGQLLVSRLFHPSCVAALTEMLGHERRHFQTFDTLLRAQGIRHCYALSLWALGGMTLGLLTALAGVRAIWVCTAAIESTVNAHLHEQVRFLAQEDPEALAAVESIQRDEEAHEHHALEQGGKSTGLYKMLHGFIRSVHCVRDLAFDEALSTPAFSIRHPETRGGTPAGRSVQDLTEARKPTVASPTRR